jgi:transposase
VSNRSTALVQRSPRALLRQPYSPQASTGPAPTTPSPSSTRRAPKSSGRWSSTTAGLTRMTRLLSRAGVKEVAIERGDGPIVDALLETGFEVFVIAPNQVKNLRHRYGAAGNKNDHFDAYVLADTLRTDRRRLHPLTPDSPATVTLRMTVRARKHLVAARIGGANQLRAQPEHVLPGAIKLFRDIDSAITLAFLTRFPTPRHHRPRGRSPSPHHRCPRRRPDRLAGADQGVGRADRDPAARPPRRDRVHLPAQDGSGPRRATARRDR